jgi:LmbE family N-acetylglucosaminyl deacetylase
MILASFFFKKRVREPNMKTYEAETNTELVYRLRGLGKSGAVLHIGAHPDDEDIGLLAYLSCKFGVRSVYWSATRGEGGQNRIGPYREEALGIYRTWESLAARAVDRSECLFGPFYDFGYSKNADGAMAKWGRQRLVGEIVRAIRMVQPQIIVARWMGTPGDFHGHHQAVGQACLQAFEAAGDPQQFPEHLTHGLPVWQSSKFYHSLDNSGGDLSVGGAINAFGRLNPALERDSVVRVNTGEYDPVSGRTYQERAWLAYNKHQTQAMGLAPGPGDFYYYFSLYKSVVPVAPREENLHDGLDISLTGLADNPGSGSRFLRDNLGEIQHRTQEALDNFRAHDPLQASRTLLGALALLRRTREGLTGDNLHHESKRALDYYLTHKVADFEDTIARCLGLELECLSERSRVIPGERFRLKANLWNHRDIPLKHSAFSLSLPPGWEGRLLETIDDGNLSCQTGMLSSLSYQRDYEVSTPETADLSCPYWLPRPAEAYVYEWPHDELCAQPFGPPLVQVVTEIELDQERITLNQGAVHRQAFPGGFRELPVAVIPPISLHPRTATEFLLCREAEQTLHLQVIARNNSNGAVEGRLELIVPPEWQITPGPTILSLTEPGETKNLEFTVTIPAEAPPDCYALKYKIHCGHRDYDVVVTPVRLGVPGLPSLADASNCIKEERILSPAHVAMHLLDVQFVPNLSYAYIQGAQEDLLVSLKPFHLNFHLLQDEEMGYCDLAKFAAVVVGPNAYLIRAGLQKYAGRFLEYVRQGGVLIIQYQGYRFQQPRYGPFPFRYSMPHDRVTDENAPVRILDPDHVLFKLPNPIREEDFHGWVRERGLYFFGQFDDRYHPLLSCSDPGEEPLTGGLVECQLGRGTFVYTGYSFFRQLPAGVPGAFRLFANLLALPEARILERIAFLRNIDLFSALNETQLDAVARIMTERWVDSGDYICRQGDLGYDLYVVYRGKVEVVREISGQEDQVVFVARGGDSLGEMAVLGNIPRTASLRTKGKVQLLVIEGSHFLSLLRQNPDMSIQLLQLLVKRLVAA